MLALIVASSGCVRPELAACRVLCGDGALCPRGEQCGADGFCHADGDDSVCGAASADDGGSSPDDDEPTEGDGGMNDEDGGPSETCADDGAPCGGATPAPICVAASTLRVFTGTGHCAAGECAFAFTDRACTAGCSGAQCAMPPACALLCDHVGDCGGSESSCRTTCRDSCPASEFDDLELCADTICEQLGACLDQIVSCL